MSPRGKHKGQAWVPVNTGLPTQQLRALLTPCEYAQAITRHRGYHAGWEWAAVAAVVVLTVGAVWLR